MALSFIRGGSYEPNSANRRLCSFTFSRRFRHLILLFLAGLFLLTLLLISGLEYHRNTQASLESLSSASSGLWGWKPGEWGGWQHGSHVAQEEGWSYGKLDTPPTDVEEKDCLGWDPMRDEGDDPVDCLKARQYRQTTRVLEREKKALQ